MNWKKLLCGAVAASMIFSASLFCSAQESANDKLARIEIDTYGTEQSGAILDRISRLEKSYSGQNMSGNMNARIEAIYNIIYDNSAEPGILAKVNVLEWNINHEVVSGGIDLRLTALENQILGETSEGTFNERILALAKATYGEETLPLSQIQIPANTLIKVATIVPVNAKALQEGDTIPVKVLEDVFVNGSLVFAKGLPGEGVIVNIRLAKNIFTNGKIETDFNKLKSLDGQEIKTYTGVEALEMMDNKSMSQGLSLIGQTFSGKNKGVEEVFIRGKNIDLPADVALYVQIKEPVTVYGLRGTGEPGNLVDNPTPQTGTPNSEPETKSGEEPKSESGLEEDERGVIDEEKKSSPTVVVPVPKNETPAPTDEPGVEARPEEGKTLEGKDNEDIEIIDDECN